MVELASAETGTVPDLHRLVEKVLTELGRSQLPKSEAGRIIAREYAEQVCNGTGAPVEGARANWRVSLECEELSAQLGVFGGRVSEYEGLPDERGRLCEMIVSEAEGLITQAN